jgi:hypothetical protein
MEETNELLRKCDTCNITKPKRMFYRYKYCKRCHIKDNIRTYLIDAHIANHLNLSIEELNNIMKNIDPTSDRYDEIISYYQNFQTNIITDEIINNFLDEIVNY